MNSIETLIATLSGWIWGPPMLTLLVGTGLYLTILLKGLQFRVLPLAFRMIFHKDHGHHGDISHFAALMTALAATVGIGNIVGVATAITLGGPGAVFWMWMTGLVGMVTKYSVAVLAVKYREKGKCRMRGWPIYYLANLEFVWNFSDLMNGMTAIPNLIGSLLLSKVVNEETDRYFKST